MNARFTDRRHAGRLLARKLETERQSHYFRVQLSQQFDGVLFFDETRAVEPLERTSEWARGEVAETFPSGM